MAKKQVRSTIPIVSESQTPEETVAVEPPVAIEYPLFSADETMLRVQFDLPLSVLIALLDPTHPRANVNGAAFYDLFDEIAVGLSPIGEKVLSGVDQTAIRHKMR